MKSKPMQLCLFSRLPSSNKNKIKNIENNTNNQKTKRNSINWQYFDIHVNYILTMLRRNYKILDSETMKDLARSIVVDAYCELRNYKYIQKSLLSKVAKRILHKNYKHFIHSSLYEVPLDNYLGGKIC